MIERNIPLCTRFFKGCTKCGIGCHTACNRKFIVAILLHSIHGMLYQYNRAKLYQAIDRAEADIAAGRVTDAREVSAGLRAKYGL